MGIFNFLKTIFGEDDTSNNGQLNNSNTNSNNHANHTQTPVMQQTKPKKTPGVVNLTKDENASLNKLNLRKEALQVCLTKKNLNHIVARVAVVMDKSGSMQWLYDNGMVQDTIERLLPLAMKFDDNGELDMWIFNGSYQRLDSISEDDFFDYVNREIIKKHRQWGGTNYAPIINDIVRKYAKEEPSDLPSYVIFITDGENFDRDEAERAITEASKYNIFFQFIGLGDEDFEFLHKLDEMDGRFIDNANFFQIDSLTDLSDSELYNKLMTEYPLWEKEAKKKGLLK